jgi:hypothetical protein
MLRFAVDRGWTREMQEARVLRRQCDDEMAHVRLNRNCIYVGGMDFEERGGPSLCGAAASWEMCEN